MPILFLHVGLVLALATLLAIFARGFRLPLLLAYIVTGILVAYSGVFTTPNFSETLRFLAELGITFLLFLVGMEMRFSDIKYIGKAAFFTGIGQIVVTALAGFFLVKLLGFGNVPAVYIAIALTFSSTIIVVKLLTEKHQLDSLYGKITVGFLLVQDFVAIAALIFVTSSGQGSPSSVLGTFLKGAALVALIVVLNRTALPIVFDRLAKHTELLFLGAVAWAVTFAAAAAAGGFSIEIGAFLAGIGLATLREEHQIASRVRPLRDLFIVMFFIVLGIDVGLAGLTELLWPVLILSLFVLFANPVIVMVIMWWLGFRSRTSFLAGVATAQVSEFSLVLVTAGERVGHIDEPIVSLVTAAALVTIAASSYLIVNSSRLYKFFLPLLKNFQKEYPIERRQIIEAEMEGHVVLIGAGRLGWNIMKRLKGVGLKVLVIDFNPEVVRKLESEGIPVIYGDMADPEILEEAKVKSAKAVVSTVAPYEDTLSLLAEMKKLPQHVPAIVSGGAVERALEFYRLGASYVIMPRLLSSHHIGSLLVNHLTDLTSGTVRKEHLAELKEFSADTQITS